MRSTSTAAFTEEDGHQLAADMLRELSRHWLAREDGVTDDRAIADLWRNDDCEILRRYLSAVRKARSKKLERGFLCVLTDQLGAECQSDADFYEGSRKGPEAERR